MTNLEKLEQIKAFLDENGIKWRVPVKKNTEWRQTHLHIDGIDVNIRIENTNEEDNQKWYLRHKGRRPVFIREKESLEFIKEKVQNVVIKAMQEKQAKIVKEQKKTPARQ